MDCRPPGSSVRGILQARILEWVAVPLSRGSSRPRDLNPGLLHCRQILSRLSHQGSPEHIKLCPDVSSELTRGLVLRVGPTGDMAKEVVRCCGPVGEEGDAFARMMAQTEDRARETQAVLISGQKVTRVDSAHRDCSSPLVFYTN